MISTCACRVGRENTSHKGGTVKAALGSFFESSILILGFNLTVLCYLHIVPLTIPHRNSPVTEWVASKYSISYIIYNKCKLLALPKIQLKIIWMPPDLKELGVLRNRKTIFFSTPHVILKYFCRFFPPELFKNFVTGRSQSFLVWSFNDHKRYSSIFKRVLSQYIPLSNLKSFSTWELQNKMSVLQTTQYLNVCFTNWLHEGGIGNRKTSELYLPCPSFLL